MSAQIQRSHLLAATLAELLFSRSLLAQTAPTTSSPSAATAPATTPPEASPGVVEARRRYAQGVAFFHGGRFEEAIVEFNEAYSLWQNPTVLHALAQAHERMLHVPRAIHYYTRYLNQAPPDATNRDEVVATVRDLRALLSDLEIHSNVVARVFANDEDVGEAPGSIQLAIGRHDVELRAEGYVTQRQTITLAARTRRELTFHLAPTPTPVAPPTRLRPVWFWVGAGVTAASAVTAATLGVFTLAASSEYQSDVNRTVDDRDNGRRLALATDVTLGATAVFGVGLIVVGLNTAWSTPTRAPVSFVLDPSGRVLVGGRF